MDRIDRLGMRVRTRDKERWREAAAKSGMSMSAWIEANLNRLADETLGSATLPVTPREDLDDESRNA